MFLVGNPQTRNIQKHTVACDTMNIHMQRQTTGRPMPYLLKDKQCIQQITRPRMSKQKRAQVQFHLTTITDRISVQLSNYLQHLLILRVSYLEIGYTYGLIIINIHKIIPKHRTIKFRLKITCRPALRLFGLRRPNGDDRFPILSRPPLSYLL